MTIVVSSSTQEKVFNHTDVINVGTNPNCDIILNIDFDILLTIQHDLTENKCVIMNTFHSRQSAF